MTQGVVVVEPGAGVRVGNVEFLCLSEDSPRFNAALITMAPRRDGPFPLVPPGVEHTFANRTDSPVRMLNIHAPAGFDLRLRQ